MSILKNIAYTFLSLSLLICNAVSLSAQRLPAQEFQVKGVFLYNFTQFVRWPSTAYPSENSPLVIGVLGDDPFGPYLDEVVDGEEVNGHPIVVQRFHHIDEVDTCHILFINMAKKDQLEQVMQALEGRSILTVSDEEHFMQQGGIIRFMTVDNKIRFQINTDAAKLAGLALSSKLLSLAEIITHEKNK